MADTALKLVLLGDDRSASKALKGVGTQAGQTGGKLSKFGGMGKAAMLGVAGAVLTAGRSNNSSTILASTRCIRCA